MQTSSLFYNLHIIHIFGFVIALLISFILTPLVRSRAVKLNVLDRPSARRIHKDAVPRLGGVSIYLSFFLTILILQLPFFDIQLIKLVGFPFTGIIAGGAIIFFLGLFDDIEPLSPKIKLFMQILAASVAWYLGIKISSVVNPFFHSDFFLFEFSVGEKVVNLSPLVSYLITVIWLVVITNAINLIDGMDGLATGVSLISATGIWALALDQRFDQPLGALVAAILAGGLLGFLRWNFNPARIFLGDSGAYLTGFLLASLTVTSVTKKVTLAIMTPILILLFIVPIVDTLFAVIRRLLKGRSILEPDKEHLHHRILAFGFSQKIASYLLYSVSALFGLWATYLVSVQSFLRFLVLIGCLAAVILFYACVINWKHQKIFKKLFLKH